MIHSSRIGRRPSVPHMVRSGAGVAIVGVVLGAGMVLGSGAASASSHATMTPAVQLPSGSKLNGPISGALAGSDLYVANQGGNNVTEVNAKNGDYVATVTGPSFGFDGPTAIALVGGDLFVANGTGDSLTEFSAGTNTLVQQISGDTYGFSDPIALAASGTDLFVLSAAGAVTEVNTTNGALVGVASGPSFGFDGPLGIAVSSTDVFVTNGTGNTLTEIDAQTLDFRTLIAGTDYQFDEPAGIVLQGNHLWVANEAASSVTELSATTGLLVQVVTNGNLPTPGPIIKGDGYVFTASPPGSSPMVSQITPSTGAVNWMVCNTNGPYKFNNPQSLVLFGTRLWVINDGGNSLTQINAGSGALIRRVS